VFYPAKSLVPSELTAYYPLPERVEWGEKRFLAAISLAIFITTILVLSRTRYKGMLAAWLAYLAILGPQLGLIRIGPQLVADRYGYLAMMVWTTPVASAFIVVVAAARARSSRLALAAIIAAGLGVAAQLAFLSRAQVRIWRDSVTLWTHVQQHGGARSPVVQIHLALAFVEEGRLDEAIDLLTRSVALDPTRWETQNNLGWILMAKGRLAEAITRFETAIRIQPEYPEARNNWGVALAMQSRHREAVAQYDEALRLFPDCFDAHRNLAASLLHLGESDAAVDHLEAALRLRPASVEARQRLDGVRRR
jgi:tetratricopeptide (TPR) repeat protein